ncbi:deoxyguanosinetriphosphate triphosphohydrolase [Candidatus Frankia alpina]|uniref:Deoxyguanosinetriphosphate triphosphohydrolase n=1 Tax=Candidatus Frankia alpina TaxID=2699483 RepID=A0A4S5ETZ0_9ACTN|nr:deoxyguanosinetriphosphate triphosphohydrolase [Candidatus Frankia alpina]THJ75944.1 deoxyguanosinetriphosphate triphosphohydrolase [Candidatus Frankia alpina]
MVGEWYDASDTVRRVSERPKATPVPRALFVRDRARVLHSSALRRLAGKTQVVGPLDDDFPRTRLTHSLETAQVGRELAAELGADADLVDAACLAHDLGHPPFGHNGELALDEAAAACGGFEGNAQSLRELTRLEVKIVDEEGRSAGLNLTRASLDAATKYPWARRYAPPEHAGKFGAYDDDLPMLEWVREGAPPGRRCFETQIMDWADDVAYSVHDLEDGVVGGHIELAALDDPGHREELAAATARRYGVSAAAVSAALDTLRAQPWWIRSEITSARGQAALRAMTSELIARFSRAAVRSTRERHPTGPLRRYGADLTVDPATVAECAALKGVTAWYVMERPGARTRQARQREVVAELVELLLRGAPRSLDPSLRACFGAAPDDAARLRVVVDQVARLTDASAGRRHAVLSGRPVHRVL